MAEAAVAGREKAGDRGVSGVRGDGKLGDMGGEAIIALCRPLSSDAGFSHNSFLHESSIILFIFSTTKSSMTAFSGLAQQIVGTAQLW